VLPVPGAGSATATIDVPGEQADVHVLGGLIQRRSSANGRTTIEATLPPGTQTEVWWSTHDTPSTASARDVRLLADVKSVVTIADADVRLASLVTRRSSGRALADRIALPAGCELASVSGASIDRSRSRAASPHSPTRGAAPPVLSSASNARRRQDRSARHRFARRARSQRGDGRGPVEGLGSMEVTSPDMPGLRGRIDVRE
jgi:hypothetical protein